MQPSTLPVKVEHHEDGGLIAETVTVQTLKKTHKLYFKSIGVTPKTKNNINFVDPPYFVDEYTLAYGLHNKLFVLSSEDTMMVQKCSERMDSVRKKWEYRLFCKLKHKYFLIDGHKFGGVFLAYQKDPQQNHAEAIIFSSDTDRNSIVQASRLATIAKKMCLVVDPETLNLYSLTLQ